MRKRGLCCRPLSVRLSACHVGGVHSIHTAEGIVKLLCRPDSPIILVFDPSAGTQFQGEPIERGTKYKCVEIFYDF